MMAKTTPLKPITPKLSIVDEGKIAFLAFVKPVLWVAMILAGFHILVAWGVTLFFKGVVDSTPVQYSILVAVGSYFCLVMNNKEIEDAMKIKTLSYIENGTEKSRMIKR